MRNLTLFALALASVVSLAAGCRDTSSGDDTMPDGPGSSSDDTRIQDIQNDAMPSGTEVTVRGVVVTAIDNYGGKKGDIWVEEPEGGQYSGVHVYGAPLDQVAALHVGDVVDITGAVKDDFHYNGTNGMGGFEDGYAITELKPVDGGEMTVTATGGNMPITPDVVNALAIGQLTDYVARDAEWEKWEGVLIKVNNVRAETSDKCVGSTCSDSTLHSFDIVGGAIVESGLGPMPTPKVAADDCLGSVTGVLDYFFDYQILPRDIDGDGTTEDFVVANGTCPTEDQAATCGDGTDNDGDGFADCEDNDCILALATCHPVTTINALQTGTLPTGGIELQNVYVASLSKPSGSTPTPKNMWVQSSTTAAASEGLYVFGDGSSLAAFTPGTRVNIIGKVTEFNDMTGTGTLTELKAMDITAGTSGTSTLTPVTNQTVAAINTDNTGEPYESVLVTLTDVKVTTLGVPCAQGQQPPACNYGVGVAEQTVNGGTAVKTAFRTDDDINVLGPAGTCYASVKGIWTYFPYDDVWGFLPLSTAGTGTGNCAP
jgi:hypothetical protein